MRASAVLAAVFAAVLTATLALVTAGCNRTVVGSGTTAKRTIAADGEFAALRAEGAVLVAVTTGAAPSIAVEGDDNLLELVHAETNDGLLRVWTDGNWSSSQPLRVAVSAKRLEQVAVAGAVTATVDAVEGDTVALTADGASTLYVAAARAKTVRATSRGASKLRVTFVGTETAVVQATGSATVEAAGDCAEAKVTVEGAAQARGISAKRATVVASGAASADLDVTELLRADASGASHVTYGGSPKVEGSVNKTSTVGKRGDAPR